MPQDDLAHNLNRSAGPGSICGSVSFEIVLSQLGSDKLACLLYDDIKLQIEGAVDPV